MNKMKNRVQSLVYSIYDGFFYSSMVGYGETYFAAYALLLGANNFQLGILTCLPPFLAAVSQIATPRLLKRVGSRKKMVCLGVASQAATLIPLALAYYCTVLKMEVYIVLVSLYFIAGSTIGPVWNSWMGDLVKPEQRGSYFGRRNRVITIGTFLSMTTAGFVLRYFQNNSLAFFGFLTIFTLAIVSRCASLLCLTLKSDPPPRETHEETDLRLGEFLKGALKTNHGVLVFYLATINFAVYLSAAYFTPRMIKGLQFDYITYTIVLSGIALSKSVFSTFWGEICDKLGNRKVLLLCGFLISLTTVPWIFAESPYSLFVIQCYGGLAWSGYELSTFAFLLDSTKSHERARVSSCLNIVSGTAGLAGGIVGAILVSEAINLAAPYKMAFGLSAVIRIGAFFYFAPKIQEVRILEPVKMSQVILKATGFRAAYGLTHRLVIFPKKVLKKSRKEAA